METATRTSFGNKLAGNAPDRRRCRSRCPRSREGERSGAGVDYARRLTSRHSTLGSAGRTSVRVIDGHGETLNTQFCTR